MRKKLLIIQEAMGGCGRNVADIVRGVDQSRFDVTVIYGTSRMDDYYRDAMPEMMAKATMIPCAHLVREISPKQEIKAYRFIKSVIRDLHPDIVHCHSSKAGIIGRAAAKSTGVKKVFYTPHAYSFLAPEFSGTKRRAFIAIERFFSRHMTTLTFNVSQGEKQSALSHNLDRPSKFKVIYNGIPDIAVPSQEESRSKLGLPQNVPVVGVTARLVDQKDPMTFARIAKKVIVNNPDVHFVYIGDGPYHNRVADFCRQHGIDDHVHLLGYRADAELVVSAFDVYLLTSLYEGFPYSPVEALRAGVPIVATRTTGNTEIVRPHGNGLMFPVGDADAGARAVETVLADAYDPDTVRKTFLDNFTVDTMLTRIQEEYLR
ncbi:glycosyltransferase [Bifidobacterium biavatii]|uniref:Exopolysaccharide biosynthesis protein n=1 Tax=Bifidobacterium biavatii DSM 23969 TaxID=1437608 RepID=A0A086ZT03_9BIFI|nr:glycosyltransferase [Bifidobacterium biavatii]KFI49653.1 exopolysaccharide biosynthesis protein [Bifidobacterium biavatii DSM 23969]